MTVVTRVRTLCAALLVLALAPASVSAQDARVPGELIVRLAPDADVANLEAALANRGLTPKRLLVPALNIWLVGVDAASDGVALDEVRRQAGVQAAQFNHEVTLRSAAPEPLVMAPSLAAPNDDRFDEMWGMHNTGQNGGTPGADVDALRAWDITTGGISATGDRLAIAIVDGGTSLNHADLDVWTNPGEIPGNGVDDDGNGYVDDVNGWDAFASNGNVGSSSHGTHVAGTAGAIGDNDLGVTGINWDAQVISIEGSSGSESIVIEAYGYALALRNQYDATNGALGAFVVATNSSFGVDFANADNYPIWCGFYDDLGAAGILSTGATANINIDIDVTSDVPTACPSDYMIAVTNTDRNDNKNGGAAYGRTTIDLGAPGTSILSTNPGSNYGNSTGTSMATPHVAGAVALMISGMDAAQFANYRANPAAAALEVKQAILDGTDDIGIETVTGGRLNLFNSLQIIQQGGGGGAVGAAVTPIGSTDIPAAGGALRYGTVLTNTTDQAKTVDVWAVINGPIRRLVAPISMTLAPGASVARRAMQPIPGSAPAGDYTYTVNLGTFPGTVEASGSFGFSKQAALAGSALSAAADVADWAAVWSDEETTDRAATAAATAAPTALGVRPNPTRGSATFAFELADAADVRLAVYDVLGRQVALLQDGALDAGTHTVAFDGRALPAGAYVYRLATDGAVQTGRLTIAR